MSPFRYTRPATWEEVVHSLGAAETVPMGGGTDLIPLVREGLARPATVVDLRGIDGARSLTWLEDGGVSIGAAVTLRHLSRDERMREHFGALARACNLVGSLALRHMGTLGGNLCQRMRCEYFRHGHECLRNGGAICSARDGENERHAIFQQGPCVAVHPSDPAVALTALDATIHVEGPAGPRAIAIDRFFAASSERLDGETRLAPGEVVTTISLPGGSAGGVQLFEKVMQRSAWDFALVSIAGIKRRDGEVRLVLGGVANTPFRVTDSVEEDVASGGLSADDIETLAERALYDARPLAKNAYKVEIAGALLRRTIASLVGG
jgi:xanthine dehydrogenase YagS FAD-binding subunit